MDGNDERDTIHPMTVYVRGYGQKEAKEVQPPTRHFQPKEDYWVQYSDHPDWRIAVREIAESDLRILTSMRVRVGDHYCDFAIEELPEGGFAIICPAHPPLHSSRI
jgi:hypothetical protein